MTEKNRNTDNNRGGSANHPQNQKEGDAKNIETSVNNPGYFDDDYESKAEEEITGEESKTGNEGRAGKK